MKRTQTGLSLIGFVFVLGVVAMLFLVAARAVPAHTEYFSVQKVLKDVLKEVGDGGSKPQFSAAFDRRAQIDDITAVKGADIRVQKAVSGTVLSVEYEKRQNLIGYVSLVFDFTATTASTAGLK